MGGQRGQFEDRAREKGPSRQAKMGDASQIGYEDWASAVPGVRDVLDPRLAHPANAGPRAALLRTGQRDMGNTAMRLVLGVLPAGMSVLQMKLPPIAEPKVTSAPTSHKALLDKVKECRSGQSVSKEAGAGAVSAAAQWLESQGVAQFSNQADIVPGSPEFRRDPSSKASGAAQQAGSDLSTVAGFAYLYDTPQGKARYKIEIYPRALMGDSDTEAASYLTGVIGHEYVHILQFRKGGTYKSQEMEFQAWLWQAEQAVTLGTEPLTMTASQIVGNMKTYYDQLSAKDKSQYKSRFDKAWKALQERPSKAPSSGGKSK